ncbi:MAG: acyl--CoA ligase [Rhodospirillaceae bacterium]|nr:acyl--CoA ligase [Rhodospirillaceae bacterium]
MSNNKTVFDLIKSVENVNGVALSAPDRPDLTYKGLLDLIERSVASINDMGIGRNDRVAIVLANGPEMATAFLAFGAGATTAPLNPNYRADEYRFYLEDLNAKALVVEEDSTSPSIEVAVDLGIPVIRLHVSADMAAGEFDAVAGEGASSGAKPALAGFAQVDDVGLVLHTSGTTSRPKLVPLSQRNLVASALSIGATLKLTPADRSLNIMPLFHIHGLIAVVLSSLTSGASVYCTPGFNALKVFKWMADCKPTWYSAVPTMHQAILSRASKNLDIVKNAGLRFVRSSSSSLPPQVMSELEETFACPVIEAYGMTEATHQMASNPLPPAARKPGTVGIAAGPEVGIMDEQGNLLGRGETGEIVIKGDNVTAGYENNPQANIDNFTNGWFRTGDQGIMDAEGYLAITGRLKEIINRGGEKISPREVDEVLMDHPAVQQVVTFAIPHDKLGEEVAAVIVLREGAKAEENEIRDFAKEHLADFKVPRKIIFMDEIPKGATGKLQRIGLAEKLGLV